MRKFSVFAIVLGSFLVLNSGTGWAAENDAASAARGLKIFQSICSHCHTTTHEASSVKAPGLKGVFDRHNEAWLNQWLTSPEAFAKKDETAKKLVDSHPYKLVMPTFPQMQNPDNRADVIEYLKTLKDD